MSMVDAIAAAGLRDARANTTTLRFGTVAGAASGGLLPVTVGGATINCNYVAGTTFTPGDWVGLFVERDMFIVFGKMTPAP